MANVLILGGDSAIGRALCDFLKIFHNVTITTRRDCSPTNETVLFLNAFEPELANIDFDKFDIIINLIANSKFEDCYKNPLQARKLNIDFPLHIARCISDTTRFIQFSTSAVLACETPFQPAYDRSLPRSEYGQQKREAEDGVLSEKGEILRISKVLQPTDILGQMLNKLKRSQPVEVFNDLYFCPLTPNNVMQAVKLVIDEGHSQIYQLSGDKDLSYEEALRLIATNNGCNQSLIIPLSCHDYIYSDHVLRYTSLDLTEMFKDQSIIDLKHQNIFRHVYG